MLVIRLVFGLLLVASVLCFAMYIGTREAVWRGRGLLILRLAVLVGLAFFAVLLLEDLVAVL